jgi:hypothetical protein
MKILVLIIFLVLLFLQFSWAQTFSYISSHDSFHLDSLMMILIIIMYDDVVTLRLWTAGTNEPIVHPPGDIWAWRTVVEYRQGTTQDSSTRALLQSYQQSSSSKAEETGEWNDEFGLTKYLFHTSKGSLKFHKILWHGADDFPPKEGKLQISVALTNPRLGLNPRAFGPMTSTLTTRPPITSG